MSTELATTRPAGLLAMMDGLEHLAGGVGADLGVGSVGPRLKFDGRVGIYTLDGQVVPAGTEVVFNFAETTLSKICWVGKKPVGRHEKNLFDKKPLPADQDLEDHGPYEDGEGWSTSISFMVKFLHDGTQASFSLSSWGGRSAADALVKAWAVAQRLNVDADGQPNYPVVSLDADKKTTRDGNTIYAPVFKIVEWLSAADLAAELAGEAPEAAPAPAPKAAPKAAPTARAAAGGLGSGLRGRRA